MLANDFPSLLWLMDDMPCLHPAEGVSAYLASQDKDCIDVRKNPVETDVNMRADQGEDRQKTAVPRLKLRGGIKTQRTLSNLKSTLRLDINLEIRSAQFYCIYK